MIPQRIKKKLDMLHIVLELKGGNGMLGLLLAGFLHLCELTTTVALLQKIQKIQQMKNRHSIPREIPGKISHHVRVYAIC